MKKHLLYVIILLALFGCKPNLNNVQQRAEKQVKNLIDNGDITHKYVQILELAVNDSNHIYRVYDIDSPIGERYLELPSKIIEYKNKYICFIELYEPELPKKEVDRLTNYTGNALEPQIGHEWLLGISTYGERETILEFTPEYDSYFDYIELCPYFSGYTRSRVQMGISSHDIQMTMFYHPMNMDSVKRHIVRYYTEKIFGEIYLRNNTDSIVWLRNDTENLQFAIFSKTDTLYLALCDTLPIRLIPHERRVVKYESIMNHSFFNNLSSDDPWMHLYQLLCDSAFCLMKRDEEVGRNRVMHLDCAYGCNVINESGKTIYEILNRGIYDKNAREYNNVNYWYPK